MIAGDQSERALSIWKYSYENTPGTRVGPGRRDQKLADFFYED